MPSCMHCPVLVSAVHQSPCVSLPLLCTSVTVPPSVCHPLHPGCKRSIRVSVSTQALIRAGRHTHASKGCPEPLGGMALHRPRVAGQACGKKQVANAAEECGDCARPNQSSGAAKVPRTESHLKNACPCFLWETVSLLVNQCLKLLRGYSIQTMFRAC